MGLETGTYISDFVATNPTIADESATTVDHFAIVKGWTLNTFPNITNAVTATHIQLNYLDIATLGTAQASKALTADASSNINAATMTWTNSGTHTTIKIDGGTVDGAIIGGANAAAGTFTDLTASGTLNLGTNFTYTIPAVIADISTLETVWVVCPVAGTVARVDGVLEGTISGSDANVTVKTAANLEMATLTFANAGSAAGDVVSDSVINNDTVTAGQPLKIETDGLSTGAQRVWVTITIEH